jgi:hypothetical protein
MNRRLTSPTAKEATEIALEEAAALIEALRARVEEQRFALKSASINWSHAGSARHLANELLHLASLPDYDEVTSGDVVRQRVLADALRILRRNEGRTE